MDEDERFGVEEGATLLCTFDVPNVRAGPLALEEWVVTLRPLAGCMVDWRWGDDERAFVYYDEQGDRARVVAAVLAKPLPKFIAGLKWAGEEGLIQAALEL